MKLKKLQIKKYKNLIDFTVDFESGKGLSILIGNNGSGKSNVLEAISGIFVNAYSAKAIHKFVYSLTYEIKGKEVKLEQTIYRCQYYVGSCEWLWVPEFVHWTANCAVLDHFQ